MGRREAGAFGPGPHLQGLRPRRKQRLPFAVTIETRYGRVGLVHAEVPYLSWSKSFDVLDLVVASAVDDALLGANAPREVIERRRRRGVEGLRALVHGHEAVEAVDIDTGAGIASLNRLSLVEVNDARLRAWTFGVDESGPQGAL